MEKLQQVGLGYILTQQIGRGCIVKESSLLAASDFTEAANSETGVRKKEICHGWTGVGNIDISYISLLLSFGHIFYSLVETCKCVSDFLHYLASVPFKTKTQSVKSEYVASAWHSRAIL